MQFVKAQEYSMFTRIVFDTAPTVSNLHMNRKLFVMFIVNYVDTLIIILS